MPQSDDLDKVDKAGLTRPRVNGKRVGMRSFLKALILSVSFFFICPNAFAESGPVTLNVDVPPGAWKAARLKNLPKDAVVAVQVQSSGDILVALLDSTSRGKPDTSRPLFSGRVERRLSFSVTVTEAGDHYLVFDNRRGSESRAVTVTLRAAPSASDRLEAANKIMKIIELQLAQMFIFDPFPIGIKQCGKPRAFVETSGVVMCTEYVYHLYDILKSRENTTNIFWFSIFHEISRVLLSRWGNPFSGNVEAVDELATVLMLMGKQRERVIAAAEYTIKNPVTTRTLMKLFPDDNHPLSVKRAKNVLIWAKDPNLPARWQPFLVPHMQTELLKTLKAQPTSWTDLSLVKKELASREKKAI